ncbi:MAG: hypothetical protein JWM19_6859, partial [Actinomycetia bacterium]|nr:hypothetical protein [Actinomycetes bacterium]
MTLAPAAWKTASNAAVKVATPAAGLHFVVFQPTIGNFIRTRLAMDGHYPDGTVLSLSPRSHNAGFNSILFT